MSSILFLNFNCVIKIFSLAYNLQMFLLLASALHRYTITIILCVYIYNWYIYTHTIQPLLDFILKKIRKITLCSLVICPKNTLSTCDLKIDNLPT